MRFYAYEVPQELDHEYIMFYPRLIYMSRIQRQASAYEAIQLSIFSCNDNIIFIAF